MKRFDPSKTYEQHCEELRKKHAEEFDALFTQYTENCKYRVNDIVLFLQPTVGYSAYDTDNYMIGVVKSIEFTRDGKYVYQMCALTRRVDSYNDNVDVIIGNTFHTVAENKILRKLGTYPITEEQITGIQWNNKTNKPTKLP